MHALIQTNMSKYISPKVTLVSAGSGDADLLTVKGINALGEADVVLFDALVNTGMLRFAPVTAKKVYVGQREGQQALSQQQINTLLVDYAYTHGHVVRLKGRDSFVSGNGNEEVEYIESFNIPVDVVTGVIGEVTRSQ